MTQRNLELPSEILPEEAALLLAIKLFETEKLSMGKAAELAGYSKHAVVDAREHKEFKRIPLGRYPQRMVVFGIVDSGWLGEGR